MSSLKTKKEQEMLLTSASHEHEKGLNKHAFFKIYNHTISQDLVQDTFMKTWRYLIKGGKIENMKAFLYHVLNQLIVDQYRKHKTVSLDAILEKGIEPSVDYSKTLMDVLDGKEAFFLIDRLPLKYKKVIYMKYVDDLSIEEIASITKQSKNNTTVQIHRGLGKLKILYEHSVSY